MIGEMDRNWLAGVILVVLGLLLLAGTLLGVGGEAVPLAIGVVFLVAYAARRTYGFLIPGGILTGLGAGIVAQDRLNGGHGGEVVLGLGLGFLAIYAIDSVVVGRLSPRLWPLIPGGILTVVGLLSELQGTALQDWINRFWPILLIVAGVALLARTVWSRPRA
jgi:hypothetical protein